MREGQVLRDLAHEDALGHELDAALLPHRALIAHLLRGRVRVRVRVRVKARGRVSVGVRVRVRARVRARCGARARARARARVGAQAAHRPVVRGGRGGRSRGGGGAEARVVRRLQ